MRDSFSQTEEDKSSVATAAGHSKKLEAVKEWLDEHKRGRWSAYDLYSLIRLIEAAPSLTDGAKADARTELVGNAGAAGQLSALRERVIASLTQYIHQERVRLSGVYSSAFGAKDVKPEEVAKYNNQTTAALANAIELIKVEFRDAPLAVPQSEHWDIRSVRTSDPYDPNLLHEGALPAPACEAPRGMPDFIHKLVSDWYSYNPFPSTAISETQHRCADELKKAWALAASVPPPTKERA